MQGQDQATGVGKLLQCVTETLVAGPGEQADLRAVQVPLELEIANWFNGYEPGIVEENECACE